MRFIHSADWHFGAVNQPEAYRIEPVDKLLKLYREVKAEFLLVSGDVFDRSAPSQIIKDQLINIVFNNKDVNFVFLVGNHDYSNKSRTYSSMETFKALQSSFDHVTVVDSGSSKVLPLNKIDRVSIFGLSDGLDEMSIQPGLCNIGMWHGSALDPVSLCELGDVKDKINRLMKKMKLQYLALGHIHLYRKINDRCYYPGSLYPKVYGNEDGVLVVDMDKGIKVERVSLSIPKRVVLKIEFDPQKDTEESLIDCVLGSGTESGSLIKLKFSVPVSVWSALNKSHIASTLKEKFTEVKFANEAVPEVAMRQFHDDIKKAANVEDEVKVLVEGEDYGVDKGELINLCINLLNQS